MSHEMVNLSDISVYHKGTEIKVAHPEFSLICNPKKFIFSMYSKVGIPVTFRSMAEYMDEDEGGPIDPNFTPKPDMEIIEIGAGLSEFVPYVVKSLGSSLRIRPVVIDPLNYHAVIGVLETFLDQEIVLEYRYIANELITRAKTFLDPTKVRLINLPLESALSFAELQHKYDIVIDYLAAKKYSYLKRHSTLDEKIIRQIEESLKK